MSTSDNAVSVALSPGHLACLERQAMEDKSGVSVTLAELLALVAEVKASRHRAKGDALRAWKVHVRHIHNNVVKNRPVWGPEDMRHLVLALCGETGELANLVKKEWRGDFTMEALKVRAREELADVRIYLELVAASLEVDVDLACREKLPELYSRWPEVIEGAPGDFEPIAREIARRKQEAFEQEAHEEGDGA